MRTELTRRLALVGIAIAELLLAVCALVLAIFLVVGLSLLVVGWGVPIVVGVLGAARPLAQLQRRCAAYVLGRPVATPYVARTSTGMLGRLRGLLGDPAHRRDGYWLLVHGTVGLALSIVAVAVAAVGLVFWSGLSVYALLPVCGLAAGLLDVGEKSALAQRVEQLADSRADAVDTQAAELRRIERDLHDGAQARLVALGMSLSLAESQLEKNPALARELLAEATTSSRAALAELRDLVRGIQPPVLADRGLVGAVHALALQTPVPAYVTADVPAPLPAPLETAAYFAVAEAVTNAVKHAGATRIDVELRHARNRLHLTVRDNGRGGAVAWPGGGLDGIGRRLGAFDGTLAVESPVGGPTAVHMVLPCASSSPKTSPSSVTD